MNKLLWLLVASWIALGVLIISREAGAAGGKEAQFGVATYQDGGTVYSNGESMTPQWATVGVSSSGTNTIVSAVSGKKIKILSALLWANGTVNVYVVDGAGTPVALIGNSSQPINLTAQTAFVLPYNPTGWQITSATNVNLNLNLSGAVGVSGVVEYVTQ